MEGRRMAAVSLVVLAMVVVAAAQGRESFIQADGIGEIGHCAKSCNKKCALKRFRERIAVGACFAFCTVGCTLRPSPSPPVLSCARNCANYKLNRIHPHVVRAGSVEAVVVSCYASCNKNNNF